MQLCISFPLCENPHPSWRRGRDRGAFLLRTYMWFPVAWRSQGRKQQIIAPWMKGKHVIICCCFHKEVWSSTIINTWLINYVFLPSVIIVISFNHLLSAGSREKQQSQVNSFLQCVCHVLWIAFMKFLMWVRFLHVTRSPCWTSV